MFFMVSYRCSGKVGYKMRKMAATGTKIAPLTLIRQLRPQPIVDLCMDKLRLIIAVAATAVWAAPAFAQSDDPHYTYRKGDPNGIGKWYMGREIAHVMGHQAMNWLERPERQREERVDKLIGNLNLDQSDTLIDVGAGTGYHALRIAAALSKGLVYAVDIQKEMLDVIQEKAKRDGIENVAAIMGGSEGFELPEGVHAQKVLMVDVYHEFSHPVEMMAAIREALEPGGLVFLVEYRLESEWVPIKKVHKMSEVQAVKEMEAAGFSFVRNMGNLPWQHCMVFQKTP